MKSFVLKAADLRATRRRAAMQGKQSIWLVKFPGFVAEIRIQPDNGREVG